MFLVQLLLPLNRNDGTRQPAEVFAGLRDELVERFDGLTAYARAPAVGLWDGDGARTARDDVVIVEVMVERVDHAWWADLRKRLEQQFEQEAIVVRAVQVVPL